MSEFWNGWIIALTVITIAGSFWLLFANRSRPADSDAKTGHVYDGIEEFDNPLPAWWLYMFVATLLFTIGYLVLYPGFGSMPGLLGWTQTGRLDAEVARAKERYEPVFAAYRNMPIEDIARNDQALRMGQRLFANNCAQCHGADAQGSRGFPNLADTDWSWGGSVEAIQTTITQGRQAAMPPWVAVLGEDGVNQVAEYVLSLPKDAGKSAAGTTGETHFKTICASCHGADGSGNPLLGAPRLNDDTWLYGNDIEQIRIALRNGRNGQMPAFGYRLDEDRIRLLTAYVYSLSR